MKTFQFKTNIMCDSCIAKVTPVLNENLGENKWNVDIKNPKKILTVSAEDASKSDIINAVEKAGYKAEEIL